MTLLFLHVPKTGGTTIHHDLRETFGVSYLRSTLNRARGGHEFLTADELERHLAPAASGMLAISGHLLRCPVPLQDPEVVYTTVVRDPFDWALSHYFHARRKAWIPSDASFETYLTDHYGLGNYQTLHFAPTGRAVDAIPVLERFAVVGVTDQLRRYRQMLAAFVTEEMGVPMTIGERTDNVAPNRTRTPLDLHAHEQRVVLEVLGEDVKLYHYARMLFLRQWQKRASSRTVHASVRSDFELLHR